MKYLKIGGEEGYEWCIEKLIDAYNNGYIEYERKLDSKLDNTRDRLFIKIDIEQAEYWKAKQQSKKLILRKEIINFDPYTEILLYCEYCKRLIEELRQDHSKCGPICCHTGNGTGVHHWYNCMCCKIL